jgi:hypothetical protein
MRAVYHPGAFHLLKEQLSAIEEPPIVGQQVKPCPRCGAQAELARGPRTGFWIDHTRRIDPTRAQCPLTRQPHFETAEKAIAEWEAAT